MQISSFESTRQEEYLNPKLTIFQIMTCVSILSAKGKVKSQNMIFWNYIISRCYDGY
jgi:hypothetical protein